MKSLNRLSIRTLKDKKANLEELYMQRKQLLSEMEVTIYEQAIQDFTESIYMLEADPVVLYNLRRTIARSCGLDELSMLENNRNSVLVIAREYYAYYAKLLTDFPLSKIGDVIKKDHSMILYYIKEYKNRIEFDPKFKAFEGSILSGLSVEFPGLANELEKQRL